MSKNNKASKQDYKAIFEAFGIDFIDTIDNQIIADCPFTDKSKKLYVDPETGLWDSKSAGLGGNIYTFISEWFRECLEQTSIVELAKLSEAKGLPMSLFKNEVAFNPLTNRYMIPQYNVKGVINGIGHYTPAKKLIIRTKGLKVGLNNIHEVVKSDTNTPIFICEGEFDFYACKWLIKACSIDAVAVCTPGAGTFKSEWLEHLQGRRIVCLYDNDNAGEKGETKAYKLLDPIASSVKCVRWLDLHKNGYDLRDFILDIAKPMSSKPKPKKCYNRLKKLLNDRPRVEPIGVSNTDSSTGSPTTTSSNNKSDSQRKEEEDKLEVPTRREVEENYGKWLKMADYDALAFMYGTCFANRISGDPVWSFMVAPPAGSKTELLMTLNKSRHVETVSTVTPASLISGMKFPDGLDPSIIPKLNNKMLVIKDFTTILTMNSFQRDEVMGIFRDVYDGYVEKPFGNGMTRRYTSSFGMLAGVTPTIDTFQSVHSSLGERFIKWRMDKDLDPETEEDRLMRVLNNINKENDMRHELQLIGQRVMAINPDLNNLPTFSEKTGKIIMRCARFTAKLRSAVDRDKYTDALHSIPTTEVATRLTKVYMKFAMGVAIYYRKDKIDGDVLRIVQKVARDTAPAMAEYVVARIYKKTRGKKKTIDTQSILKGAPFCSATLSHILRDLTTLRIAVKVTGSIGLSSSYKLSQRTLDMIEGAGVY